MAIILAGGEGERLSILSQERAKPAVPFGGKYRIIDFTLSNCVNSDIHDVVVLTQYNPRSLNDHIGLGRPWDLDRNQGGVKLLQPYIARGKVAEWYRGTADAVLRNMNVVEHDPSDVVVVLAGDHIYKMDYQPFIAAHRRRRADVTIAVRRVPLAEASRMGILALDETDRVIEWQEKPKQPKSDLASMGVYVFSKKALRRWLSEDRVDFGRDIIPAMLEAECPRVRLPVQRLLAGRRHDPVVLGGQHGAPRRRPGARPVRQGLADPHPLRGTRAGQGRADGPGPPIADQPRLRDQRHGRELGAVARRSGRCRAPSCAIRSSCSTRSSASGAVVDRAILDKEVVVGPGAIVGDGPIPDKPNKAEPGRLNTGITVVGKRAVIPRGARIGRNVKVAADVRTTDFVKRVDQERRVRGAATGVRRPHEHEAPAADPRGRPAARDRRCGQRRERQGPRRQLTAPSGAVGTRSAAGRASEHSGRPASVRGSSG